MTFQPPCTIMFFEILCIHFLQVICFLASQRLLQKSAADLLYTHYHALQFCLDQYIGLFFTLLFLPNKKKEANVLV